MTMQPSLPSARRRHYTKETWVRTLPFRVGVRFTRIILRSQSCPTKSANTKHLTHSAPCQKTGICS